MAAVGILVAAAVASLLSPAGAQAVMDGLCDPNYDCAWTHVSETGKTFDFQFKELCSSFGYSVKAGDTNGTIRFNVCGRAQHYCAPKTFKSRYLYGAAVLFWGETPPCNVHDPNESFFDKTLNKTLCYTSDCEVLGVGTPIWTLNVNTAPANGGILLEHAGVARLPDDPNKCPKDLSTGDEAKSTVTMLINCDKTLPRNVLSIFAAYRRGNECSWVIEMRSGAACGCQPNCPNGAFCGSDDCGGYCSGAALAGRCPMGQVCMKDKTCCVPDCKNRDCGDDGCGGSCGTCSSDETCSSAQVCISTTPFIPQAPVTYAADSSGLAGSFFGGAFATLACAGGVWFFGFGGRAKFDRWRYGASEVDPEADAKVLLAKENKSGGSSSAAVASSPAASEKQSLAYYKSPLSSSTAKGYGSSSS